MIAKLFANHEKLTRPTAAFLTFEEEDAKLLALKINDTDKKLIGQKLEFK